MSKKKTVKAPLTYNPGKGRPKEHLAYLNWQEMQALKRLNGNNQEQGPKGLPSFPPADARSGSYNSGYGSASRSTPSRAAATPSRTTTTSRTSGPSGNLSAPVRTAPSASAYGRTTTTTRSGGTPSAAPRSISGIGSPSRGVTPSYSRGVTTPSAQRTASGVGSPVDRAVKQAVETRSISSAQKTPALAQDRSKASGGYKLSDITGTNVPGGKVTGAIQSVKDLGIAGVPGTSRISIPSTTSRMYTSEDLRNQALAVSRGPGVLGSPKQERIARTVAFSESVPGLRQPAIAKQLQSTALSGGDLFGYKGATPEQQALMNRISSTALHVSMKTGLDPRLVLGQALHESSTSKSKSETRLSQLARDYNNLFGVKSTGKPAEWDGATTWSGASSVMPTGEYYGPAEKKYNEGFRVYESPEQSLMDYGRLIDKNYGKAGQFKNISQQARAIQAGKYATDPRYAKALTKSANRVSISPRPTAMSTADVARSAAYMTNPTDRPYDVSTSPSPDRIRSIVPTGDTAGRTTVPGLISYPDLNRPVPPSVGRSAVVPTVRPRKEITDRILPEPPGRKLYYDRISPSGGAPPVGIGAGDIGASAGVGLSASGNITVPSRSIGVFGGVNGNAGYSQDLARNVYVGSVTPAKFRGATDIASSFPPGVSEPTPTRMRSAIETAPNKSYFNIPSPVSTGMLPAKPPTPFRSATAAASALPEYAAPPAPTYSQIPTPDSIGILPSQGIVQRGIGALKSFDKAAFDTLNDAASYVKRYSDAQKGFAGGVNKFSGIFNKGVSQSDQAVVDATQSALKTGAQKISSLQQSWNNAVEEARRVNPAITETKNEDISRGLKTVNEAEGDKLPSPPTTVPPPVENFDEVNKFKNISMAGGLGMVPYNKPGSTKLGVSAEQSIDKRERDLQKYYEGKFRPTSEEDTAFANSLIGEEASKAAKAAGFPRNVYTNAGFTEDPTQLGLTREEVSDVGPEDMAKIVNRSRQLRYEDVDPYLGKGEGTRSFVTGAIERGSRGIGRLIRGAMGGESAEQFLSRPSWEQDALYQYAKEANVRYNRDPLGRTQVAQGQQEAGSGVPGDGGNGRNGGEYGTRDSNMASSFGPAPPSDSSAYVSTPSSSASKTSGRPDIYYMWDLGVNIPSPGDPNYTQYQTYLIDRAASQRAMGWA